MLTGRAASFRAHLRSHSGLNAGIVLSHAPTAPEFTVPPHLFRVILLERLALPLPVNEARCDGCHLDTLGRHWRESAGKQGHASDSMRSPGTGMSMSGQTTNVALRCWPRICRALAEPNWPPTSH